MSLRKVNRIPPEDRIEGECFAAAFNALLLNRHWRLVHGRCHFWRGLVQQPHAWLEHSGTVYDPSLDTIERLGDFYSRMEAVKVTSYDVRAALQLARTTGHCGPWADAARRWQIGVGDDAVMVR